MWVRIVGLWQFSYTAGRTVTWPNNFGKELVFTLLSESRAHSPTIPLPVVGREGALESERPGLEPLFCHLPVVWPWAYDFVSSFVCTKRVTRMLYNDGKFMAQSKPHPMALVLWIPDWRASSAHSADSRWAIKVGLIWIGRVSTTCPTHVICI